MIKWLIVFATGVFLISAVAKLYAVSGDELILAKPDPIFPVTYRQLMVVAASVELAAVAGLRLQKKQAIQCLIVASVSLCFVTYHMALHFADAPGACPCLGSLASRLPLSESTLAKASEAIAWFLFLGAGGGLVALSPRHDPSLG